MKTSLYFRKVTVIEYHYAKMIFSILFISIILILILIAVYEPDPIPVLLIGGFYICVIIQNWPVGVKPGVYFILISYHSWPDYNL